MPRTGDGRTILMLQGPPCRFWRELGQGLRAAGHRVIHRGFHLGDRLLWRGPGMRCYRGRLADWPGHLARLVAAEGVSDILYYADCLPYHAAAVGVARRAGIRAWTVENGYLRPDWITLEPEAMGARSRFTRDPEVIRRLGRDLPVPDMTPVFTHGFAREAVAEVGYHLAMTLGRPFFPRYVSDKHYPPVLDYLSWLRRWCLGRPAVRAAARAEEMARAGVPYFLVALQLQSDYQIRCSSPYASLAGMIGEVLASFAAHAPAQTRLVFKLHPMDNGWENWPAQIRRMARRLNLGGRVVAADGGELGLLLDGARGVVTANSTLGIHALRRACPVIALGDAVYDIPGLTHQDGLDRFWTAPAAVDAALLRAYIAVLAGRIQVRGSFYHPGGRRAAIDEIVRRLGVPGRCWVLDRPATAPGSGAGQRPAGSGGLLAAE